MACCGIASGGVNFLNDDCGRAERQAGAPAFQRAAETLEDTLRAGRVPLTIIKGTMDAVGKAGRLLEKVAAAGKAAVEEASKKSADKEKVEETPPGQ